MTEIVVAILIACAPGPQCWHATMIVRNEAVCRIVLAAQARSIAAEHGAGVIPVRVECVPVSLPAEQRS